LFATWNNRRKLGTMVQELRVEGTGSRSTRTSVGVNVLGIALAIANAAAVEVFEDAFSIPPVGAFSFAARPSLR